MRLQTAPAYPARPLRWVRKAEPAARVEAQVELEEHLQAVLVELNIVEAMGELQPVPNKVAAAEAALEAQLQMVRLGLPEALWLAVPAVPAVRHPAVRLVRLEQEEVLQPRVAREAAAQYGIPHTAQAAAAAAAAVMMLIPLRPGQAALVVIMAPAAVVVAVKIRMVHTALEVSVKRESSWLLILGYPVVALLCRASFTPMMRPARPSIVQPPTSPSEWRSPARSPGPPSLARSTPALTRSPGSPFPPGRC